MKSSSNERPKGQSSPKQNQGLNNYALKDKLNHIEDKDQYEEQELDVSQTQDLTINSSPEKYLEQGKFNEKQILRKREKYFKFLFWFLSILLVFYPVAKEIIFYRLKDVIIFSYSQTESHSTSQYTQRVFCKILSNQETLSFCKSYTVADVIDLAWAIAPLYSCRGGIDEKLYNLHKNFIAYLSGYGIPSIQIEAIKLNSNQEYQIARPNREPYEMQSYIHNCSYMRENLLNMAVHKLNLPWEYIMWIDGHQILEDPLWIFKAIVLAEKNAAVQLFTFTRRLNPYNTSAHTQRGFVSASLHDLFEGFNTLDYGNAYIMRREIYQKIGYILDDCLANDCDVTFDKALDPSYKWTLDKWFPNYSYSLSEWLNRTIPIFNGSRAYLKNDIYHFHHQSGAFPFFEIHKVFEWSGFNRTRDLERDENFAIYVKNSTIAQFMENCVKQVSSAREYEK